jgi:hypothetical protein
MLLFICSYIEVKKTLGFFFTANIDKESLMTIARIAKEKEENMEKMHITMRDFVFYFNLNS